MSFSNLKNRIYQNDPFAEENSFDEMCVCSIRAHGF